jgi:hypothetical protein
LRCAVYTLPGNPGPAGRQTGDLLQITKYRVAKDAAAHRFPQVSKLIKAEPAPPIAPQKLATRRRAIRIPPVHRACLDSLQATTQHQLHTRS